MRYKITNNHGKERFVQAKSNAEGEEVEKRLKTIKDMGKIKSYEHLEFERITPDEVLKVANVAQD